MSQIKFKAIAVADEIDLNEIALRCNIPKKYTWEEPLVLQGEALTVILEHDLTENQKVSVFAFGSIVLMNTNDEDTDRFLRYLMTFDKKIEPKSNNKYIDTYDLIIDEKIDEITITDDFVYVHEYAPYYPDLISIVLAKSVGLEKIEDKIKIILDNIESKIVRFEKGKLRISDKELAKTISRILRHEYNSIAYIMILDKPDITWMHNDAAVFYDKMSELFELNDRYEIFKTKTSMLNDIVDGFSMISHSMKGLFVEWIIVILIIVEVILMVIDLLM